MNLTEAIPAARVGRKCAIRCPNTNGHDNGDRHPSLSVFPGDDGWVGLKCWKGCTRDEVLSAAGLTVRNLGPDRRFEPKGAHFARHRPNAAPAQHPAPTPLPAPEKATQRALWPCLLVPPPRALEAIMNLRGISIEGLKLAVERGILRTGNHHDLSCWFVTDDQRIAAQARRIDGQRFFSVDGPKGLSLPGTVGGWPIGTAALKPEHRSILFCEGGPDLLAAHAFIWAEGREANAAAVAMLGASASIAAEAIEAFRGRKVRFVVHADEAGKASLTRWSHQLHGIADSMDSIGFGTLSRADGQPCNDLNDTLHVSADTFERARVLHGLTP